MTDAALLCVRLIRTGTLPLSEMMGALDDSRIFQEVKERLHGVGLALATSPWSDHVGIRLAPELEDDPAFDAASNLGLSPEACALLVVLWARLVLPRSEAGSAAPPRTQIRFDLLVRELRPLLGDRRHIRALVARLRQLDFLEGQGEVIEAGPLLELGIDGDRLVAFFNDNVLAGLGPEGSSRRRRGGPQAALEAEAALILFASQVHDVLKRLGGAGGMTDLVRETGAPASRLRNALRLLVASGEVRRSGQRRSTRYHLQKAPKSPSQS